MLHVYISYLFVLITQLYSMYISKSCTIINLSNVQMITSYVLEEDHNRNFFVRILKEREIKIHKKHKIYISFTRLQRQKISYFKHRATSHELIENVERTSSTINYRQVEPRKSLQITDSRRMRAPNSAHAQSSPSHL